MRLNNEHCDIKESNVLVFEEVKLYKELQSFCTCS